MRLAVWLCLGLLLGSMIVWWVWRIRAARRARRIVPGQPSIELRVQLLEAATADIERQLAVDTASTAALVIANRLGRIISVEGNFETLFGYAPADVLGHPLRELMPERFRSAHDTTYGRTGTGPLDRFVAVHGLHRDGHEFPIQVRLGSFVLGEEPIFYGLVTTLPVPVLDDRDAP